MGDPDLPVVLAGRLPAGAEVRDHRRAVGSVVTNRAGGREKLFAPGLADSRRRMAFGAIALKDYLAIHHGQLHVPGAGIYSAGRGYGLLRDVNLGIQKLLAVRSIDADVFGKNANLGAQ